MLNLNVLVCSRHFVHIEWGHSAAKICPCSGISTAILFYRQKYLFVPFLDLLRLVAPSSIISSEIWNPYGFCSRSLPVFFGVWGLLSLVKFSGLLIKEFIGTNSSEIVSPRGRGVRARGFPVGAVRLEFLLTGERVFLFSFSKSFSWRPSPGM
jgi:hypothetical protein